MLGSSRYQRNALDFYPTPARTVQALLDVIQDDLCSYKVWEPFAGNGAFSKPIADLALESVSTDIRAYEGFDPDGLFDFFKIEPGWEIDGVRREDIAADREEHPNAPLFWTIPKDDAQAKRESTERVVTMADIANLKGFMPDAIITNPPYGKDAERAARHALALMEAQRGLVIFLCRHEWDAAKSRRDLFDHPAFASKITLRHRPRWIEGSDGAPRFPYAYFVWDWTKPAASKPELIYAA